MTKQEAGEIGVRVLGCYFGVAACAHTSVWFYNLMMGMGGASPSLPYKLKLSSMLFPLVYAIAAGVLIRNTSWCMTVLGIGNEQGDRSG
jgi:hypothetical protein